MKIHKYIKVDKLPIDNIEKYFRNFKYFSYDREYITYVNMFNEKYLLWLYSKCNLKKQKVSYILHEKYNKNSMMVVIFHKNSNDFKCNVLNILLYTGELNKDGIIKNYPTCFDDDLNKFYYFNGKWSFNFFNEIEKIEDKMQLDSYRVFYNNNKNKFMRCNSHDLDMIKKNRNVLWIENEYSVIYGHHNFLKSQIKSKHVRERFRSHTFMESIKEGFFHISYYYNIIENYIMIDFDMNKKDFDKHKIDLLNIMNTVYCDDSEIEFTNNSVMISKVVSEPMAEKYHYSDKQKDNVHTMANGLIEPCTFYLYMHGLKDLLEHNDIKED